MCIAFARAGHKLQHLSEVSGISSSDVLFDGVPADLKSTRSHNNMMEYAKWAVRHQGAKIVLFRFEVWTKDISTTLKNIQKMGIHGWYYILGKEDEMHEY